MRVVPTYPLFSALEFWQGGEGNVSSRQKWLVMPRFTQPEPDQTILLHKLKLELPQQPPSRIKTRVAEFPREAVRL